MTIQAQKLPSVLSRRAVTSGCILSLASYVLKKKVRVFLFDGANGWKARAKLWRESLRHLPARTCKLMPTTGSTIYSQVDL
jgi:hypothetical protein